MHKMRRKDRQRGEEFCLELIDRTTHGIMALTTGEDIPYCLPLSFIRKGRSLYFHCANEGRKLDLLRACPKVCVTFVSRDEPTYQPEANNYTTLFSSAIVTGTAHEITEEAERVEALRLLCQSLLPHAMVGDQFDRAVARSLPVTAIWRIDMEELSGKDR